MDINRWLVGALLFSWGSWGVAVKGVEAEWPRTVSVVGQGQATAPPDMAIFEAAVVTEGATAAAAMEANSAAVKQLLATLKKFQIADKDIQTSRLDLSPRYSDNRNGGEPKIVGYTAQNQVTVRVRNLPELGTVLDGVIQAGSNQLSGIRFDIDDPTGVLNQARNRAVADARARAELYAHAAGVKLGKVVAITEQPREIPRPMMNMRAMAMEAAVPMATGEQELSASIQLTYELVD